jgi:hypothetical protein
VLDPNSILLQALGHSCELRGICGIGFGTIDVESSGAEVDDRGTESEEPYAAGSELEVELVRLEHGEVWQKSVRGVLGDRAACVGKHEPEPQKK